METPEPLFLISHYNFRLRSLQHTTEGKKGRKLKTQKTWTRKKGSKMALKIKWLCEELHSGLMGVG